MFCNYTGIWLFTTNHRYTLKLGGLQWKPYSWKVNKEANKKSTWPSENAVGHCFNNTKINTIQQRNMNTEKSKRVTEDDILYLKNGDVVTRTSSSKVY